MKSSIQIISAVILMFITLSAIADEIVILNSRDGVEQTPAIELENPKASLILFAGGKGASGLT
ncbi:MAG: hypothetical protein ABF326_02000 [Arenicellales bacterium]